MSTLADQIKKAQEQLVLLQSVRKINSDDLQLPQWIKLKAEYDAAQNLPTEYRAVVSILNSILFQNRIVFCLSRPSLKKLISSDNNFKNKSFDHNKYRTIILHLTNTTGLLEVVSQGSGMGITVYKLVHPAWRSFLINSEQEQLTQALDFQSKSQNKEKQLTAKLTGNTDIVDSSKKIVDSIQDNNVFKNESAASVLCEPTQDKPVSNDFTIEHAGSDVYSKTEMSIVDPSIADKTIPNSHKAILKLALSVPADKLTDFEKSFLKGKDINSQLTDKQASIVARIAAKAKKEYINPEAAKRALSNESINTIIEELSHFDCSKSKGLAKMVFESALSVEDKKRLAQKFDLTLPKPPPSKDEMLKKLYANNF